MAGFHLTTGNDQSILIKGMGDVFRQSRLSHVLEPERIVVQSMGMKRWMSLQLAGQLGVHANCRFLFPNQLLGDIFERVVPDFQTSDLFERGAVGWKIMELLPRQLEKDRFRSLKHYLYEDGSFSQIKSWQLARKIAYLFDQYCMYRPDMITDWEAGKGDDWQADLWRALGENGIKTHLPALRAAFFDRIRDPVFSVETLPERITVFGITSLPPFHIDVLAELSHSIDIYLFFLNPSPEYWGDIMSRKEMAHRLKRQADPELTEEELHMEQGNPLLASFGKTGRSFFDLLQNGNFNTVQEHERFLEPNGQTLLKFIQSDIFHLQDPNRPDYPRREYQPGDHSLQIHSCHSRMREVEVLHDQVQLIMTRNPDLKPGDILVMAPDINPYAPIVKAVFASTEGGRQHLPFSIADHSYRRESKVIQWFLKILDLPHSRFRMSDILDFLESEVILARYKISERDTLLLQDWLTSTNIRWGIDKAHKQSTGTPGVHQNTWEFGLDRIMLGLAMPDDSGLPFDSILPFDRIEGSQGILLGKFLSFFADLRSLVQLSADGSSSADSVRIIQIDKARTLSEWVPYLNLLVQTFFEENESWDEELQSLRDAINTLDSLALQTGSEQHIEFKVIQDYLSDTLEQGNSGVGFLGSGITFCSMLPMRSIPFKVVALLGLNDQAYPRKSRPLSFDLMAAQPKPGDRSPKEDDRYLFLEAILSAEEILYLSYMGQSIKDNSNIPASIVVSELLQYLDSVGESSGVDITGRIVIKHHLQAFNPQYFKSDPGPLSFSRDNLEAARILEKRGSIDPAPFIERLPDPDEQWQTIELDQLITFFNNPCRYLLRQRLGLYLDDESEAIEDAEPFGMGGLEKYNLDQVLLETGLEKGSSSEVFARFQSTGILPPDTVGQILFDRELADVHLFLNTVRNVLQGSMQPSLPFDFELEGYRLKGTIDPIYPQGLVHYRMAKLKTKDWISCWLKWLILNLLDSDNTVSQSVMAGLDSKGRPLVLRADPVDHPENSLISILKLYREGLVRPLPFFPSAAETYVRALQGKDPNSARQKAQAKWQGNNLFAEKDDPYFARCFGHTNPINDEFAEVSRAILEPIFSHYTEAR